eukprot:364191-Chlamydomonas_euryale.AAC.3
MSLPGHFMSCRHWPKIVSNPPRWGIGALTCSNWLTITHTPQMPDTCSTENQTWGSFSCQLQPGLSGRVDCGHAVVGSMLA